MATSRAVPTAGGASAGDIQGALPLLVRPAAKPPRATGPRGGHGPLLQELGPRQRRMVHQRGDIQGARPLLVRPAAKPPRATGPRGGRGLPLQKA